MLCRWGSVSEQEGSPHECPGIAKMGNWYVPSWRILFAFCSEMPLICSRFLRGV